MRSADAERPISSQTSLDSHWEYMQLSQSVSMTAARMKTLQSMYWRYGAERELKVNGGDWRRLARTAMIYNAIQASSVSSERGLSAIKAILTSKRNKLSGSA